MSSSASSSMSSRLVEVRLAVEVVDFLFDFEVIRDDLGVFGGIRRRRCLLRAAATGAGLAAALFAGVRALGGGAGPCLGGLCRCFGLAALALRGALSPSWWPVLRGPSRWRTWPPSFAPALAGDLVAVRFTGSSVAGLCFCRCHVHPFGRTHFRWLWACSTGKCRLCRMSASIIRVDIRRYRAGGRR